MDKTKYETAQIRVVGSMEEADTVTGTSGKRHQIYLSADKLHGTVLNDGREVFKNKYGIWCYFPR